MTDNIHFSIEEDERYFRVTLRMGTHKLHSEKLNLETAIELLEMFKGRFA